MKYYLNTFKFGIFAKKLFYFTWILNFYSCSFCSSFYFCYCDWFSSYASILGISCIYSSYTSSSSFSSSSSIKLRSYCRPLLTFGIALAGLFPSLMMPVNSRSSSPSSLKASISLFLFRLSTALKAIVDLGSCYYSSI